MPLSGGSTEEIVLAPSVAVHKPRCAVKGEGRGESDRPILYLYRTSDGSNIPATTIECKALYKLGQDELVTGLVSEIQPARDVINKGGDDFVFVAKALATAVAT